MTRPAPLPPLQIEPRPFPTAFVRLRWLGESMYVSPALARELWALEKSHRTRRTPNTTGEHDHD